MLCSLYAPVQLDQPHGGDDTRHTRRVGTSQHTIPTLRTDTIVERTGPQRHCTRRTRTPSGEKKIHLFFRRLLRICGALLLSLAATLCLLHSGWSEAINRHSRYVDPNGRGLCKTSPDVTAPSVFPHFIQGAMAVPPTGCSGPATITGSHTILLDPADTGGYTVVFSDCTVTGNLTINSTTSAVAHLNAVVDIQNSAIASTFTIAAGVLLGAGSRIRIRGLTGITAANLAGSAQDGAELLFSFVTLLAAGDGGVLITGTYATQSRLLFDFCSISTTSLAVASVTVSSASFYSGSHFNITNTIIANTNGHSIVWLGSSTTSSIPLGSFPTTIVALTNTSLNGSHGISMVGSSYFQSGSLLHISGGCTFVSRSNSFYQLLLQLKGGLIFHDSTNIYPGLFGNIRIDFTAGDAGGNYFALRGATINLFVWNRLTTVQNNNDTVFIEDTTIATILPYFRLASGLNFTLRRVVVSGSFQSVSSHSMTDSTFLIEDSQLSQLYQRAPTTRTTLTVLRTNVSTTIAFEHAATDSPLLISAVRAANIAISLIRVRSPVRVQDATATTQMTIQNAHTDSGATIVRTWAAYMLLGSQDWLRSPLLLEEVSVTSHVSVSGTFTDGRVQLNHTSAGVYLWLLAGSSLVRTALVVQHSAFAAFFLSNTWNAAPLEVLNTTVTTVGQLFAVYIINAPLNGSQHRFVNSVLVSTTTTYPPSGTEPLQGVLVYAAGFGSGGLLEVRGTQLQAQHASTYLVYAELSGSRLHYDGSNACARPGAAANRGRLHMKTLAAGTGDLVRVNNSKVDAVTIALANCTDCEVSVANTTIGTTFALDLAGQTRLAHRMLNTTVGGAVTMACSGVLSGGSVLLHELQAASVAHAATAIDSSCYAVVSSNVTGTFSLDAALNELIAAIENTTISGAVNVTGPVSNATLRFAANKLYSLSLVGVHRNASLAVDGNDLRASGTTALNIDAGASTNVTWRIQHNDMTGASFGLLLAPTTAVSNGAVAIVNNTIGPFHGVYQGGGSSGGIGAGATLWMRDNRIATGSSYHSLYLQVRGGRLDHDGSNAYGGGGHVKVYLTAADAGGNYFALQKAAVEEFLWSRSAGLATTNETIILLDTVIASNMTVQQRTCTDCLLVLDHCAISGATSLDALRTSTILIPSSQQQCTVCLVSSRFTSTVSIQGSFSVFAGIVSTLQLLNSTFSASVVVSASFIAVIKSSAAITAADVVDSAFQTSDGSSLLTFSGSFSAFAIGGPAKAALQVRNSAFTGTSTGSGAPAILVGTSAFSSFGRLYIQNVVCTTPSASNPCLEITSLDVSWFEVWNSTFIGGGIQVAVTSAARYMLIVGNRVPLFNITGVMATFSGGRIAACNQDSSTAGWPAVTVGSSVGFSNIACSPAQTVTRCRPASSELASVTAAGTVPACVAIPTSTNLGAELIANASKTRAGPPPILFAVAQMTPVCTFDYRGRRLTATSSLKQTNSREKHTYTHTHTHAHTHTPLYSHSHSHSPTPPVPIATSTTTGASHSTNSTNVTSTAVSTTTEVPTPSTSSSGIATPVSTTSTEQPTTATSTHPAATTATPTPTMVTDAASSTSTHCTSATTETTSAILHLPLTESVAFPLPHHGSGNGGSNSAITPVWRATAGSDALAAWFLADVSPYITCATDPTLSHLVCRLPNAVLLPADNETAATAVTLEATVQTNPCPSPALRLVLSLVRPVAGPAASAAATIVVLTTALVGTTAYTLVVEPWAVEPLALAGVLDGPCAPPAVQDTARIAIYALNLFAALEPALSGGMLVALVVVVVACNAGLAVIAKPRAQLDTEEYRAAAKTSSIAGRALFPRVAFAVALAALPGVAWAAAAAIRSDPSGPAIISVVVCAAYVVVVPCVGALVVLRLAPARFVPRRVAPSESVLRRVMWPSGRWTTDGYTAAVSAAMNVRGLTGGPRGGELLFVGSSLLATAVFAITVAPPASASCAARHYAASALFAVAAVVVACLRPHRAPITTGLTTLILLLAGASTAAVGAVADDPNAPYAPAAGLATAAMVLSIVRSVHAVVMARVATAADKKNSGSYSDEKHHQEMALAATEDGEEGPD